MQAYRQSEWLIYSLWTSAVDGGEWLKFTTQRLCPQERNLGSHWIRGWVDSRAALDVFGKRVQSSALARIRTPESPACSRVSIFVRKKVLKSQTGRNNNKNDRYLLRTFALFINSVHMNLQKRAVIVPQFQQKKNGITFQPHHCSSVCCSEWKRWQYRF